MHINIIEIVSSFLVLFAIIDVTGAVPVFLNLRSQGKTIHPEKAAIYSLAILIRFPLRGRVDTEALPTRISPPLP